MTHRSDWLKSVVRTAAERVRDRVDRSGTLRTLRQGAIDLGKRTLVVPSAVLSRAVLSMPDVVSSSVRLADGVLGFDLELESGRAVRGGLTMGVPRFAARGAKELVVHALDLSIAADPAVHEVAGVVAALCAHTLWQAALGLPSGHEAALVDRDGLELHCDLRTVPSVRRALGSAAAPLIEAIQLESANFVERGIELRVALPGG